MHHQVIERTHTPWHLLFIESQASIGIYPLVEIRRPSFPQNSIFDALRKSKNNGHRSWALFLTSIVNILGFLIISPLSAGLLSPGNVDMPKHVSFNRLDTASDIPLQLNSGDQMMFNTITGAILNQSTSAWSHSSIVVFRFRQFSTSCNSHSNRSDTSVVDWENDCLQSHSRLH